MSTSENRRKANRVNALSSTGPVTVDGKATASRNATRHGLLSGNLILEDECATDFGELVSDICHSLNPVGTIEIALVERIAIGLWRQRRLVTAEAAQIALHRQPKKIEEDASTALGRSYRPDLTPEDLVPFDAQQESWCQSVAAEIEQFVGDAPADLQTAAPLTYAELLADAEGAGEIVDRFLATYDGGLTGYLAQLHMWCGEQITAAENRPRVLQIAGLVQARRLVLSQRDLELFSRYQITLDNQMYKALRALREAQEWRLKTLDDSNPSRGRPREPEVAVSIEDAAVE